MVVVYFANMRASYIFVKYDKIDEYARKDWRKFLNVLKQSLTLAIAKQSIRDVRLVIVKSVWSKSGASLERIESPFDSGFRLLLCFYDSAQQNKFVKMPNLEGETFCCIIEMLKEKKVLNA